MVHIPTINPVFYLIQAGSRLGQPHPVHLHGHNFQVIKIGWPTYDPDTKFFVKDNADLNCTLNHNCNTAIWADPSWLSGSIPNSIPESPPLKDTVILPVGGYVVVRFKTDNPG